MHFLLNYSSSYLDFKYVDTSVLFPTLKCGPTCRLIYLLNDEVVGILNYAITLYYSKFIITGHHYKREALKPSRGNTVLLTPILLGPIITGSAMTSDHFFHS